MDMLIKISGRKIRVPVTLCKNKAKGLMFSRRENAEALLFEFSSQGLWSIHSFFVFYPFLALWLRDNEVIDYKIVHPFSFSVLPRDPFHRLIEIPLNEKYRKLVADIVGKNSTPG